MITTAFRSTLSAISIWKINWGDWLAPTLILVTPFVNFLNYHNYGLFHPESLLIIAILASFGLAASLLMTLWPHLSLRLLPWPLPLRPVFLALAVVFLVDFQPELKKPVIKLISEIFSDGTRCIPCIGSFFTIVFLLVFAIVYGLQKNAGKVFATVFAMILAATIVLPQTSEGRRMINGSDIAVPAAETHRSDLPPVVHIVLDEHIGIEGVPVDLPGGAALRADLLDFYVGNGFRIYGKAFSQYHNTGDSLSNLVNGTAQPLAQLFMAPSGLGYTVTENAWFDRLSAQGYRIHVYQTDYLDFCGGKGHRIARCITSPATGLAVLEGQEIAIAAKVAFFFGKFSDPSSFFGLTNRIPFYLRKFQPSTESPSEIVPDRWRLAGLGAPWAKITVERLIDDLREAESGTAYFAHLLLPHRGFVLDENCRLKLDLDSWYDYPHLGLRPGQRLASESRRVRYAEYFKQVHCARRTMGGVLGALSQSGVLDKAIVIVHGDHGSRISGLPPFDSHASWLTRTDLADSFSTLFAIRSPNLLAGYDSSVRSIQALFADLVYGRPIDNERAAVFLTPTTGGPRALLVEYPLPDID